MIELTSAGRPVQLSPGTSVQLEYNSPLFDEDTIKGEFSYSFAVPAGPNGPLYGFPERPDALAEPGAQLPAELSLDGLPLLTGTQRVKSASASKYSVSVQAGLSGANLSERPLTSFRYGGLREVPRLVSVGFDGGGNPLRVPGLPLHANAVVADPAAYPYVFAPLRNEYLSKDDNPFGVTPDPLTYPPHTVNAWYVFPQPLFGLPAGGTFNYTLSSAVPGGIDFGVFTAQPPYCPFPRLRYVLQCVFEESGLAVDLPNLLPGELGEVVIAGNAQLVDRGDLDTLRFGLADVLPALTVAELLAALRQDLGLVVYVDPLSRRVRSATLRERVDPAADYADLSERLAGYPEATIEVASGLTLTYQVDSSDELTKDLLTQQPAASLLRPAVATVADLPATIPITTTDLAVAYGPQVRLVEAEGWYYAATAAYVDGVSARLTWTPLVVALPPVAVNGGGEEQAQATCYTATRPTRFQLDSTNPATVTLPAISQPPYLANQTAVERSTALRLLFYNGLQLASDGVSRYPQLSHLSASGALSLRLGGPAGTYQQLLRDWLPVKLRGTSYKQALLLTALDLARLDLARPLRLDGVAYLIKKLSATVPLRKPATVELVRL